MKFHAYITVRIRFSMVFARPYVRRPSEAARGIFGSRFVSRLTCVTAQCPKKAVLSTRPFSTYILAIAEALQKIRTDVIKPTLRSRVARGHPRDQNYGRREGAR